MQLTRKERQAFAGYWNMPLRVKAGNVELRKGDSWGILCNVAEAKTNAQIIIKRLSEVTA